MRTPRIAKLRSSANTLYGTITSFVLCFTLLACDGDEGLPGLNSLVRIFPEAAGSNCTVGGYRIATGLDSNRNESLDSEEIQSNDFICNGAGGKTSLVKVAEEVAGSNCSTGGIKIQVGLDDNNNNVLDASEIKTSQFVCKSENVSQLRFDFNAAVSFGLITATSITTGQYNVQIDAFNIENYVGVDSVIFGGIPISYEPPSGAVVELYDCTHDKVIANSAIVGDVEAGVWTTSANCLKDLPKESIDLCIRISSDGGGQVSFRNATLILIWK